MINAETQLGQDQQEDLVRDNATGGWMTREAFYERLKKIQEEVAQYLKPGVSAADELIAERREEARRFWSNQS